MIRILCLATLVSFFPLNEPHNQIQTNAAIQVALLLDTSNSMDGLINQAKSQLWKLVNELAESNQNGQSPTIEIAVYEYGNDQLSAHQGYVREVLSLTNDLDEVSNKLFQLSTQGGSEYCGKVILTSLQSLPWDENPNTFKLIAIAGNEPFTQGPVTPEEAYQLACKKDVSVTTIFCGDWNEGIRTGWKDSPECIDLEYLNIDQDKEVRHIPTPYDDTIVIINQALNETYLGYGSYGDAKKSQQMEQDVNALAFSSANLRERISFKAKSQYSNTSWDLVDAYKENQNVLNELSAKELPDQLKGMNKMEQQAYLKNMIEKRAALQTTILEMEKKAESFIASQQKEAPEENTLDKAMFDAIHKMAGKKGFSF